MLLSESISASLESDSFVTFGNMIFDVLHRITHWRGGEEPLGLNLRATGPGKSPLTRYSPGYVWNVAALHDTFGMDEMCVLQDQLSGVC